MEEKIVLAALAEMKVHSFRFTMEDLARRMHVSKSTLYKAVSSKEELVHKVIDYLMAAFEEERAKSWDAASPEARLREFIRAYTCAFRYFEHGIYGDLQMHFPQEWERWEKFRQEKVAGFVKLLEEGIAQGVFRPVNTAVVQRALLVLSSSFADNDFLSDNNLTYSQAIESVSDWIFKGILV